jgi:hypothetical protein
MTSFHLVITDLKTLALGDVSEIFLKSRIRAWPLYLKVMSGMPGLMSSPFSPKSVLQAKSIPSSCRLFTVKLSNTVQSWSCDRKPTITRKSISLGVRNCYKVGSLKDKRRNRQMKGNIIGKKWAIKDKIQI